MGSSSSRDTRTHKQKSRAKKEFVDANVDSSDRAVLKLKTHRKKLERQFEHAQQRAGGERRAARSLLASGDSRRARAALVRHKSLLRLCDELVQLISGVDALLHEIESSSRARDTVRAMEAGNEALRAVQAELSAEHVEKVMQAYEDEREKQTYANDRIGMQTVDMVDRGDEEGEQQIEEELKQLELELQGEENATYVEEASTSESEGKKSKENNDTLEAERIALPDVPKHEVVAQSSDTALETSTSVVLPSVPTHNYAKQSADGEKEIGNGDTLIHDRDESMQIESSEQRNRKERVAIISS